MKPGIQRLSQIGISQRRICASAFGVATHDDLFDFEMGNGVLDHTRCVDVVGMYCVCNVAVHKDLARLAVAHCRLRNAGICASYPEDLGRLALSESREFVGVRTLRILQMVSVYQCVEWTQWSEAGVSQPTFLFPCNRLSKASIKWND